MKSSLSKKVIIEFIEEILSRNAHVCVRVISGSMQPLIKADDHVLVQKVSADDIKVKDIILFKRDNLLVTHRVVSKIWEDGHFSFIERGDRGGSAIVIPAESVIGKVIAVKKNRRLLRLDRGWGRMMNALLGINNCTSYQVTSKVDAIKKRLRDKPGFIFIRVLYRFLKAPFRYMHRIIVRIIFFPKFLR